MTSQEKRKDAFQTVGIEVRAKIEGFCNNHEFMKANALQCAYDTINEYCENKLEPIESTDDYVLRGNVSYHWMSPRKKAIDGLIEKVIRIASAPSESADTYIDAQLILYKLLGEALIDKTVRKPISKALYETWRTLNANERDRLEERT